MSCDTYCYCTCSGHCVLQAGLIHVCTCRVSYKYFHAAPSRIPGYTADVTTTVEPPKKGHFGNGTFVLSSEVVLISEVHEIFNFLYNGVEYK